MPRNGSGVYTLPQPAFVAGTVISSAAVNSDLSDIATALTGSLPRDGQASMQGQLRVIDGSVADPGIGFANEENSGLFRVSAGVIGVDVLGTQIGTFTANGWTGSISGIAAIPVGMLADFAGSAAPTGWLLCYGQTVSRTTYAALFTAIGTTYGTGDGTTTFGIPDLRGRVLYGKDDMGGVAASRLTSSFFGGNPAVLGATGGSQTQVLITANLPPYTPAGTITNGAITITQNATNTTQIAVNNGPNVAVAQGGVANAATITASQAASTFAGTAQGGTSSAFAVLPPGMIANKIIYAGV